MRLARVHLLVSMLYGCGVASSDPDASSELDSPSATVDAADTIDARVPPDAYATAEPDASDAAVSEDARADPDAAPDATMDAWERRPIECDLVARTGCADLEACYPAGGMGSQCARPTEVMAAPGERCDFGNDCMSGAACTRDLVCELLCDLAGVAVACPDGPCRALVELDLPPGVGTCP